MASWTERFSLRMEATMSEKGLWDGKWTDLQRLDKGGQGIPYLVRSISDPTLQGLLKKLTNNQDFQARGKLREALASAEKAAHRSGQ
jgi:hypothetical protein